MKKTLRFTLLSVTLGMLFTGCSIYHPQSVDIPLINHDGDTRIDASAALSYWIVPSTFTFNVTATHGFNDWFAGQLHGNYGGSNFYLQAAPGAYYPLGEHSVIEGYAGLGFGGAWSDDVESNSESANKNHYAYSGRFLLPFAQANIGWHDLTRAHIDLALGLKVGAYMPNFNYHELDGNGDKIVASEYDYTTSNFLLEPQFMIRFGGEHLKVNLRTGFAWLSDVNKNHDARNFYYDVTSVSAGVTLFF